MAKSYYWHFVSLLRQLPYGAFRRITRRTCRGYSTMQPFLTNECGLEIGGPSSIFCTKKLIPVYDRCQRIDSCNCSSQTIWSKTANSHPFGPAMGKTFVAEACDISIVPEDTYGFVLASHVLEHIANPLRALNEWKRLLIPGGVLLVIVPDKRATFDHRRSFTSFDHIASDVQANTAEDDLRHLDEILAQHDLGLDPEAGTREQFRERCLRNSTVRAIHHHVFSPEVLVLMFDSLHMRVMNLAIERPYHIIVFAQKAEFSDREMVRLHNLSFASEDADWRKHDPF